jgi:hypothetical protein
MTAPDGLIRIPLNEESAAGAGQIEEFLMQFNGEGIQHIALLTDDLLATVDSAANGRRAADDRAQRRVLRDAGRAPARPRLNRWPNCKTRGILLDGTTANGQKRLLLQIFSQTLLGPVFFEFIQRKADEGFGEGNFKALFESLERDQLRRRRLDHRPGLGHLHRCASTPPGRRCFERQTRLLPGRACDAFVAWRRCRSPIGRPDPRLPPPVRRPDAPHRLAGGGGARPGARRRVL